MPINKDDRARMKRLRDLSDEQVKEAEKLYYRSSLSPLAAAKLVKGRRVKR